MHQIERSLGVPYFDGSVQRGGGKEAGSAGWISGEVGDRLKGESCDLGFVCGDGAESIR